MLLIELFASNSTVMRRSPLYPQIRFSNGRRVQVGDKGVKDTRSGYRRKAIADSPDTEILIENLRALLPDCRSRRVPVMEKCGVMSWFWRTRNGTSHHINWSRSPKACLARTAEAAYPCRSPSRVFPGDDDSCQYLDLMYRNWESFTLRLAGAPATVLTARSTMA
jgi:hypothetical protein